jgi:hypothetical protein
MARIVNSFYTVFKNPLLEAIILHKKIRRRGSLHYIRTLGSM